MLLLCAIQNPGPACCVYRTSRPFLTIPFLCRRATDRTLWQSSFAASSKPSREDAQVVGSAADDLRIFTAMLGFIATYRRNPALFQSFAVVFDDAAHGSEEEFERHLWARVQSLCDNDARLGHPWDNRVASDADNPHFSLSVAGEAFFVVGLHPHASRPARRFRSSALVFNLHDQFERLRADGRYEKLRATILERDEALAGSINPMLMRHGELSEARQYSGRLVDDDWRCPFHASNSASAPRG
jgi:uncharacterized protein